MNSFSKLFIAAAIAFSVIASPAQSSATSAHLKAHVANCIDRDAAGDELTMCFLSVVQIDANGETIFENGFADSIYPDAKGNITFSLRPGTYRLSLYVARSPKPTWTRVATVEPNARLSLGEI